jgi:hypothetical protein
MSGMILDNHNKISPRISPQIRLVLDAAELMPARLP